ncbi:MAG: hypothetical protein AVDCRST_MAG12-1466, partial [uncultured Rubrobacteraceae bacterium]
ATADPAPAHGLRSARHRCPGLC